MQKITRTSVSGNIVQINPFNESEALKFKNAHSVSDFISRLLSQKKESGLLEGAIEDFLCPKIKNLMPDPLVLKDMEEALQVFWGCLQGSKKIAIFGDYDVDGACSAALIKLFAIRIGCKEENLLVYIPNRMKEGYGPNKEAIKKLKEQGVELIVTVDCGIVAFESIDFAKSLGMSVIILDHHKSKHDLPVADAVVNPNRFDERGLEYLCGAGVVFMFCAGICKRFLQSDEGIRKFLFNSLDMVAIATICDVVPLIKLNRAFVKKGLEIMAGPCCNRGVRALIKKLGIELPISANDVGFKLGPLVNAGGRLGFSEYGVDLLTCGSEERAQELAEKMFLLNSERVKIERETSKNAIELIETKSSEFANKKVIFFYDEGWHEGILGIVASRMQERYNKPAIVACKTLGEDGTEYIKASCRSAGIDIGEIVLGMVEDGILLKGGGHYAAAGFSALTSRLEEVREAFNSRAELRGESFVSRTIWVSAVISFEAVGENLLDEIGILEPFGKQNEKPVFLISNIAVMKSEVLSGLHVRIFFKSANSNAFGSAICFNSAGAPLGEFLTNSIGKKIDIICNIEENKWNGVRKPSLTVIDAINGVL